MKLVGGYASSGGGLGFRERVDDTVPVGPWVNFIRFSAMDDRN